MNKIFMTLIAGIFAFMIGATINEHTLKNEAIRVGAARYTCDEFGKLEFQWGTNSFPKNNTIK